MQFNLPVVFLLSAVALWSGAEGQGFVPRAALLIIDMQDCFLSGGSLAVPNGDAIIPVINNIRRNFGSKFTSVVFSQDWHCPQQVSFASNHPGKDVSSLIPLSYSPDGSLCLGGSVQSSQFPSAINCSGYSQDELTTVQQILWPDHCIQNVTSGPTSAEFSPSITMLPTDHVVHKGVRCEVDSYSAFFDNGKFEQTQLDSVLKQDGINTVFVTGLAMDFCVRFTAEDANQLGYETYVVMDAVEQIAEKSAMEARQALVKAGVHLIYSPQIGEVMSMATTGNSAPSPSQSQLVTVVLSAVCLLGLLRRLGPH